jgi:hypothetical protein
MLIYHAIQEIDIFMRIAFNDQELCKRNGHHTSVPIVTTSIENISQ